MNWLFRCNIASERHGDEVVQGIGHAMRCISLAREVEAKGHSALLSVEADQDVETFLDKQDIEYVRNQNHLDVAREYHSDVVVIDINYLEKHIIEAFRDITTVINLAPRGEAKYYADISFTSEKIEDVPEPADAAVEQWYAGPEFTILNDDFIRERERLIDTYGEDFSGWPLEDRIVIHMGGVDKYDRTGTVLEFLDPELLTDVSVTVVVGPFNPHKEDIEAYCDSHEEELELIHAPNNLAKVICGAKLGVLGAGISTYEALAVGVPSANIGVSGFHDMRGNVLESHSLGTYIANLDSLTAERLNGVLTDLIHNDDTVSTMRRNGFESVDGRASRRIVDIISTEHT